LIAKILKKIVKKKFKGKNIIIDLEQEFKVFKVAIKPDAAISRKQINCKWPLMAIEVKRLNQNKNPKYKDSLHL
jgi:hypothetical protein